MLDSTVKRIFHLHPFSVHNDFSNCILSPVHPSFPLAQLVLSFELPRKTTLMQCQVLGSLYGYYFLKNILFITRSSPDGFRANNNRISKIN